MRSMARRSNSLLLVDTSAYAPVTPLFGDALRSLALDLGVEHALIDEAALVDPRRSVLQSRLGRFLPVQVRQRRLNAALVEECDRLRPAVVVIVKGSYVEREALEHVRARGVVTVNFLTDDPLNPSASSPQLRQALRSYDWLFTPRKANIDDLARSTDAEVRYLPFAYQPAAHFPESPSTEAGAARWRCELSLIGGADAGRALFIEQLLDALPGLELNLFGAGWQRVPRLGAYARGHVYGREFRLAAGSAAVSLNLVRRANRDGHVMRTFELPACGACVLAERTAEHEELFENGREVLMFDSVAECADKLRMLLGDAAARRAIAEAGHRSVTTGGHTYEDRLRAMLCHVGVF